jgi:ATP-binding cassette subfamily B multidrug efflux pump
MKVAATTTTPIGLPFEETTGKVRDWYLLTRLLKLMIPYWITVLGSLVASLATTLLQFVNPLVLSIAIDTYFLHRPPKVQWILHTLPSDPHRGLFVLSILWFLVLALTLVVEAAQAYLAQWTGQMAMADLRRTLLKHLHGLPISYYDTTPAGRLVTRVTTDVEALNDLFSNGIVSILANVVMTLFFLIAMLGLSSRMTLVLATVLPVFVVLTIIFRSIITASQQRVRILLARINAFIAEHVSGITVVQLFNRQEAILANFDIVNREHMDASKEWVTANAWFLPSIDLMGTISQAGLLFTGAYLLHHGQLTIGTIVAFLQYGSRFLRPIQEISERYGVLQTSIVSAEKVFVLLDLPLLSLSGTETIRRDGPSTIEFDHVWFAYKESQWVLRDVSFQIDPGEMLAIVGHTGAGKTTLSNLLLRFYEPQRGIIRIGGIDIRNIAPSDLRRQFGVVLQDPYVREGTILENIRFGSEELSHEEIMSAVKHVGLDEQTSDLPDGLNTYIQERGDNLSSGQKQLIAFSRALAHDPSYLVLDEATSNIDVDTESRIRSALGLLLSGRTSIVIAHRLSTILAADKILVMHKGEIAESGNHRELVEQRGIYWRLYQIQFGDQVNEELELSQSR